MENVSAKLVGNIATVSVSGHVDSNNSKGVEDGIRSLLSQMSFENIVIDADQLKYVSSAGLRIILRLRKENPGLKIINVSSEVYEILDMTGFTEMIKVEKAYKSISVEGCVVIGEGANGKVYRIDDDTIVKVYKNPDSLDEIHNERELARKAFVLGIPTAISYDIVRVGDGYGSVFEKLSAKSLARLAKENPELVDEYVQYSVNLLKTIHSTEIKPDEMPMIKPTVLKWVHRLENELPEAVINKLAKMVEETDHDLYVMHGDYHFKNIMYENGEALLIDMDTLCTGHPVFEFASIYNAYVGFGCVDSNKIEKFLDLPISMANHIWEKTLELYFETTDKDLLEDYANKAKLIGNVRMAQRAIRRNENQDFIDYCKNQILVLIEKVDTLKF